MTSWFRLHGTIQRIWSVVGAKILSVKLSTQTPPLSCSISMAANVCIVCTCSSSLMFVCLICCSVVLLAISKCVLYIYIYVYWDLAN